MVIIWDTFIASGLKIFQKKLKGLKVTEILQQTFLETDIFWVQGHDSVMSGYFSIRSINFMLKGKSLLEYTNLFSPNEYEKNNKKILK